MNNKNNQKNIYTILIETFVTIILLALILIAVGGMTASFRENDAFAIIAYVGIILSILAAICLALTFVIRESKKKEDDDEEIQTD